MQPDVIIQNVTAHTRSFISWNVNGLRALLQRPDGEAALRWLLTTAPHALCLIEHKLQETDSKSIAARKALESLANENGYTALWTFSTRKGRDGLAVLIHRDAPMRNVTIGLPEHFSAAKIANAEGRLVTIEFSQLWLVFAYVPNTASGLGSERWLYRLGSWEVDLREYLNALQVTKAVVYQGDLNVAHQRSLDSWGTTAAQFGGYRAAGRTREEAAAMDCLLHECALVDGFRSLHPEAREASCWASKSAGASAPREFWKRYDYVLVSRALVQLDHLVPTLDPALEAKTAAVATTPTPTPSAVLPTAYVAAWPLQQEPLCLTDVRHLTEAFEGGQPDHLPVESRLARCNAPPHACAILHDAFSDELLVETRPLSAKVASGKLTCFGGKCEAGESGVQCLLRELEEELGGWQPTEVPRRVVELYVDHRLIAWFYEAKAPLRDARIEFESERGIGGDWWRLDQLLVEPRLSRWHAAALRAWREGRPRAYMVNGVDVSTETGELRQHQGRLLSERPGSGAAPPTHGNSSAGARSCMLASEAAAQTYDQTKAFVRWLSEWHTKLGKWWRSAPVAPYHERLGACLGALGVHLGSRFEGAHRAWLALLARPPLPPAPPAAMAEPGCGWLAKRAAQLELPDFPDFPLHFELPPADSLPWLLPVLPGRGSMEMLSRLTVDEPQTGVRLPAAGPRPLGISLAIVGFGMALVMCVAFRIAASTTRHWLRIGWAVDCFATARAKTGNTKETCEATQLPLGSRRGRESQMNGKIHLTPSNIFSK